MQTHIDGKKFYLLSKISRSNFKLKVSSSQVICSSYKLFNFFVKWHGDTSIRHVITKILILSCDGIESDSKYHGYHYVTKKSFDNSTRFTKEKSRSMLDGIRIIRVYNFFSN